MGRNILRCNDELMIPCLQYVSSSFFLKVNTNNNHVLSKQEVILTRLLKYLRRNPIVNRIAKTYGLLQISLVTEAKV